MAGKLGSRLTKIGTAVAMAALLALAGCASDVTRWNDDDSGLSDAEIGAAASIVASVLGADMDTGTLAPPSPYPDQSMAADDSCITVANAMQVELQSWGGSVQEISRRLGTAQKELFQGRCAGHPQAAAYIAGANRMLGDAETAPEPQMASNDLGAGALLQGLQQAAGNTNSSGGGDDGDCPQGESIARKMNNRTSQLSSVVEQTEVLMWGMEELISACPSSPERASWELTLASATRTCNQVATRTCQAQWH